MKKKMVKSKFLFRNGIMWFMLSAFVSCAQGFDSDELFQSDVQNAQLESPAQSELTFSRVFNADGSQSVKVSWPVVNGASGYECIVNIVNDPENPQEIYHEIVDGTSFLFPRERNTYYKVSVRTIGNVALNNQDAQTSVVAEHNTFVQPMPIPSGNLEASIKSIMDQYGDPEYIFELEAGGTYEINSELDFGDAMVTLQGDESQRPIVTFGLDGVIRTSAGLTLESVNFDCTQQNSKGVIECSSYPSSTLANAQNNAYYLQSPIIIQDCNFKNVTCCLFTVGHCSWAIEDVRVIDCIIQLNNDGSKWSNGSLISGYSTDFYYEGGQQWYGGIKNITLRNNTIYNLKENSKNRVIRFNNNTLSRVFPTDDGTATIENNTIYKVFTGKEFGNNTPNKAQYVITFNNNVLQDVYRLTKFIQGNCTKNINLTTNTLWAEVESVVNDGNNSKAPDYATEENPMFVGPVDQELDLTQPNGGVNFKARGTISSTVGDPRWLE